MSMAGTAVTGLTGSATRPRGGSAKVDEHD